MKTIFALASAPGRAGVAVLRLSGPKAENVFGALCVPCKTPAPRQATLRRLVDPATQETLDHALVLWFPAPHSFTGENVVELHLHGGRAVLSAVLSALSHLDDFEPAGPGDFSRRAFENGRLDLTEAEAIADLVDAQTARQRRQALRQMEGALGHLYKSWAERLTRALAFMEAAIDFADEEIPEEIEADQLETLRILNNEIQKHLQDSHRGERLREGFVIALIGAPNAGKSSLLNLLAGRDAAIVSPLEGTTRDVIEISLDLDGWPLTLADTAGLRETAEEIESEGVKRALSRAQSADLKIALFDAARYPERDEKTASLVDARTLSVWNKADTRAGPLPEGALFLSAKTGEGLELFRKELQGLIEKEYGVSEHPSLTRVRHRAALEACTHALTRALNAQQEELRAEDVRLAMRELGKITGTVDVEDLLDLIFKEFCIGK